MSQTDQVTQTDQLLANAREYEAGFDKGGPAGGVVDDDAIRSLAISQNLLGTEEILLIYHTDCGMLTFTDEQLAQQLEDETGQRPAWSAHAFDDLEADLRAGVEKIKASPFVPRTESVRGFVYEVETGALREVS
jgi:carbonic anhydrase